jgi:hypothetical protein
VFTAFEPLAFVPRKSKGQKSRTDGTQGKGAASQSNLQFVSD